MGAFVVCFSKEELPKAERTLMTGVANGVPGMELLTESRPLPQEPNLSEEVEGALLANTRAIVSPFELTLGLAESAAKTGVEFSLDTQVTGLEPGKRGLGGPHQPGGIHAAQAVVNAAGVRLPMSAQLGLWDKLHITPRRGEYCLLDHTAGAMCPHGVPTAWEIRQGRAGHPHGPGNLLQGPTAKDIGSQEDTATTARGSGGAGEIRPGGEEHPHPAGHHLLLRPAGPRGRGRLCPGRERPGLFDAAGIESPD